MTSSAYGRGTVELRPDTEPAAVADLVSRAREQSSSGIVISLRTETDLSVDTLEAAAAATVGCPDDTTLYVLGYEANLPLDRLRVFGHLQRANLSMVGYTDYTFLDEFRALRRLTIQVRASARAISLNFLTRMPNLTALTLPAAVRDVEAVIGCAELTSVGCASNDRLFAALSELPAVEFLDIKRGANRNLSALPGLTALRGLNVYQVRGLEGVDLLPAFACPSLMALSLGALPNVTALRGATAAPRLRALLLERISHLGDLADIGRCRELTQLGLYESRPVDKRLNPLRSLDKLSHLALGDVYSADQITELLSWYSGSLHYRDKIDRGEFKPRWRTPIAELGQ